MDFTRFDLVARALATASPRRVVIGLLTGGLAASTGLSTGDAKKKKKKVTLCLDGQTIKTPKKKKKKMIKRGATPGACCVPACAGKPCGSADGCGGTCGCASGSLCHGGTCKACTVSCNGTPQECGNALQSALNANAVVLACPGRYLRNFQLSQSVTLIGAGQGSDPGRDTILDGNKAGRTIYVNPGIVATIEQVRVTGGKAPAASSGGGVANEGQLTMSNCTISGNTAVESGGGIAHNAVTGSLTLNACTISGNQADATSEPGTGGGGINHDSSTPTILNNCVVADNQSSKVGGGIRIGEGPVQINGSEIRGNHANSQGGGIRLSEVSGTAVSLDATSRVTGNSCSGGSGCGGGIFNGRVNGVSLSNTSNVSSNNPDNCSDIEPVANCIG
jgi:hypothetical protein